jgi:hypothetical protein
MTGSRVVRAAGLAGLVVLAAAVGVTAGFVHRTRVELAGLTVPVGLLAALGAVTALVLLARMLGRSRPSVLVVGAAVALPVLVLSQFRPEGDLVVNQDGWGLSLLGGMALVLTVGVVVPFTAYDGGTPGGPRFRRTGASAPPATSSSSPTPVPETRATP